MAEMSQFKPVLTCRGWQILLAAVDVLQTSCTRVDFWTWFRISLEPQSDKHTVKTSYIVTVFNNQLGLIVVMQEEKKNAVLKTTLMHWYNGFCSEQLLLKKKKIIVTITKTQHHTPHQQYEVDEKSLCFVSLCHLFPFHWSFSSLLSYFSSSQLPSANVWSMLLFIYGPFLLFQPADSINMWAAAGGGWINSPPPHWSPIRRPRWWSESTVCAQSLGPSSPCSLF